MGTPTSSRALVSFVLYAFFLLCPLCSLKKGYAVEGAKAFHTLNVNSLPPPHVCQESSNAIPEGSLSLKVVPKHGPCNPHKTTAANPTVAETLRRDKLRVESILRARRKSEKKEVPFYAEGAPASDFVVAVGLGTPKKEFPLLFDTGSGLIWTQSKPCKRCYANAAVFDPSKSASFKTIPCSSNQCKSDAGAFSARCFSRKCGYATAYVDNATAQGLLAKETVSLNPLNAELKNVLVGFANQVSGDSNGESGVIGLNRSPLSLPSQSQFQTFSYCIPSNQSSTGYLAFGGKISKYVKFSPIPKSAPSFDYSIQMTGVSVGGRRLLLDASLFNILGTIDSGTPITRLPTKSYAAFRSMFRENMKGYHRVNADEFLDTCYDFSNHTTVTIPAVSLFFKGGVELDIDVSGIVFQNSEKIYCLAFASYETNDNSAIIGNFQQKTYSVVFDDANGRVGFAPGGCD